MFAHLWVLMFSFIYFLYDIYLLIESLCFSCPLPPCTLAFVTLSLPSDYFAHSLPVCLSLLLTNFFYFPLGVCFNLVILVALSLSLCVYLSLNIFVSLYVSICHSISLSHSMCLSIPLSISIFVSRTQTLTRRLICCKMTTAMSSVKWIWNRRMLPISNKPSNANITIIGLLIIYPQLAFWIRINSSPHNMLASQWGTWPWTRSLTTSIIMSILFLSTTRLRRTDTELLASLLSHCRSNIRSLQVRTYLLLFVRIISGSV